MIVTTREMRAIEDSVFAGGVLAETLMDAVGFKIAVRLRDLIAGRPATVVIFAGKGNNAGDGFAAASVLRTLAAKANVAIAIHVWLTCAEPAALGELPRRKLAALVPPSAWLPPVSTTRALPADVGRLFVVDALLGIGATGALRGAIKAAAQEINAWRRSRGAYVLAIDSPTGLDADTGTADPDAVIADETLAVGFVKRGQVADRAANYIGKLRVIELPEFAAAASRRSPSSSVENVSTSSALRALLPPRPHESNKGMYGRIGLIAGSVGATGAAIMCAHACARAGAGLITLLTPPEVHPIVAGAASPEVMVKPLRALSDVLDLDFDILGLGPGLGRAQDEEVRALVAHWPKPMVVDADGLNALAADMSALARPAGARLLTPHPGEMARLLRGSAELRPLTDREDVSRAEIARKFTDQYPVALLLKGARTIVAAPGQPLAYNTTGNAGMATGGMGDVLTGICCALAGQHLGLYDAARLGAWVHGQAGDLAREAGESAQSLLPGDLMQYLGRAFTTLSHATA